MLLILNMRIFIALVLTVILSACENKNSHTSALEDYKQRIHNILDLQHEMEPFQPKKYPNKRELLSESPQVKISWRDFFNLNQCQQLQQTVAQRNNQLGKNMEPATQLLYELNLLNSFSQCQQENNELSEDQLKAFRIKQSELSLNIWNNTWASSYWQQLFSHQTQHQATEKAYLTQLVSGLRNLRQYLKPNQEIDSEEWYKAYQLIENSIGSVGSLSFELQNHIYILSKINIDLAESKEEICVKNRSSKKFEYLWNVLNKFYLTDIQKRQTELISMASDLGIEFAEWQMYFEDNKSFKDWYKDSFQQDSKSNLIARLKYQIRQHVSIWQEIRLRCSG